MENIAKTQSSYQKEVNRLNKFCNEYMESNKLRKYQISQLNLFIHKLLNQNRITIDELKPYVVDKKTAKAICRQEPLFHIDYLLTKNKQ